MKIKVVLESVPLVFGTLALLGKLLVTFLPQTGSTPSNTSEIFRTCSVVSLDPQCLRGATNGLLVQESQIKCGQKVLVVLRYSGILDLYQA
jgi:hypothetical protein